MNEFSDKTVVVTGAAQGIGRAIGNAFHRAGANVVGLDCQRPDVSHYPMVDLDLRSEASILEAFAHPHLTGPIDILVNCAGIYGERPLREHDVADLDRLYEVNVRGPVIVTREALRKMGAGARIINIVSELAYLGRGGASGYAATKAALLSFTRSWSRELAPGILVNAVAPGPVDTGLLAFAEMTKEEQSQELANVLNRIGKPEEVAGAVLFLAGANSTFVTGQCISVDGGAAMH